MTWASTERFACRAGTWTAGNCVWAVCSSKRYRQPAHNQETILAAFEEDGWPPRIDNPLSGPPDDAIDRLHNAVKKLNRHSRPLRFRSDGNGLGVQWELDDSGPGANQERPL